jgi:hypothetical protein
MKKTFVVVLALFAAFTMVGQAYADCPDLDAVCAKMTGGGRATNVGGFKVGMCWKSWTCETCKDGGTLAQECNGKYPACEGNCAVCTGYSSCWDKTGKEIFLLVD